MGSDATENDRRELVRELNAKPKWRAALEAEYGQVWDVHELSQDFEVIGFLAPFVAVRRKSDGATGNLMFQDAPRFFFRFLPD